MGFQLLLAQVKCCVAKRKGLGKVSLRKRTGKNVSSERVRSGLGMHQQAEAGWEKALEGPTRE